MKCIVFRNSSLFNSFGNDIAETRQFLQLSAAFPGVKTGKKIVKNLLTSGIAPVIIAHFEHLILNIELAVSKFSNSKNLKNETRQRDILSKYCKPLSDLTPTVLGSYCTRY
jgi:hypothetical protein